MLFGGVDLFSFPFVSASISIRSHTMVLVFALPDFCVPPIRSRAESLVCSKHSFIISCNAVPRKQSQSQSQIEEGKEKEELRYRAMRQLLMEECGFSSSELKVVSNRNPSLFRTKSTERAQEAIDLFRDSGFTPNQVSNTILKNPSVLTLKAHEQLKPKIAFFRTLGFAEKEVVHIISRHPRVLGFSLNNSICPKISLLLNLFGSKAILYDALRRAPGIVVSDIELLKVKLKFMENMGLSKNEVTELLLKNPTFLCLSMDKIQKNMEFLINTARFAPRIVVKYPALLNFNLENRLKPRYNVFEYLKSSPSSKRPPNSLFAVLYMSEDEFIKRFLEGSPEAKRIYGQ